LNIFSEKIKEVFSAVLPVTIIVILLSFTLVPIESSIIWTFIIGAGFIVIGLTLFLIGVDLGITPLGAVLGPLITKRKKLWIVIVAGLILGFFISFAEPGLMILANQIDAITSGGISSLSILVVVSIGIAILMVLGLIRILYNFPLYKFLNISYIVVFVMALFTSPEFLAIAFDASGATTGILAVPFILALSLGITSSKKDSKASEKDSFGLVAIASVGAIASVLLLNIFKKDQRFSGVLEEASTDGFSIITSFTRLIPSSLRDSIVAFLPLIIIFIIVSFAFSSLSKRETRRIGFGFLYAFIGMFIFFLGVNAGFMHVGSLIGSYLTTTYSDIYLILIGFVLGVVTILAEPAVHVLTHQIEEVTSGYVTRKAVLVALSLGVGISVALSMLRIITPEIQLWHYLLPGYIISLALTFIVPKLFVGIAFDAGGVATGPMTATFILAFTNGAAHANPNADLMRDGFGMIAMVALMPIITLQILGLIFKIKTRKKGGVKIEK
jgi:hypothetical protein